MTFKLRNFISFDKPPLNQFPSMLKAFLTSVTWAKVSLLFLILFCEQPTVELSSLQFTVQLIVSLSQ